MSTTPRPVKSVGFIHLVPFDPSDPRKGHEEGLELFEYAEQLGLDSGWVRTRHLQHGLSSPAVFFGAVSQRTKRIGLGNAVDDGRRRRGVGDRRLETEREIAFGLDGARRRDAGRDR